MRFKRLTVIESESAFMNNYTLVILIVVMVAFMWWTSSSRKKQMAKMEQRARDLKGKHAKRDQRLAPQL